MIIPCVFLSGIFMWILLACGSPTGVVLFAIFFGFFSGAVSRSSYPCVALLIMSALQYISLLPSVNASFARSVHEIGIRIGTHGSASGLHSPLRLPKFQDCHLLSCRLAHWSARPSLVRLSVMDQTSIGGRLRLLAAFSA